MRGSLALSAAIAVVLAGCGGKAVFRLSSDETNAYALDQSLARRQLPAAPAPVNAVHQPRVFVVTAGAPRAIVAYDLASAAALWKVDADVRSRVHVGGDFVVAVEGKQLVARDQARGAARWKVGIPGELVGAAADAERAYLVYREGSTWWLEAYGGARGDRLWRADASGPLGAPAAHGGVVYVPFHHQWLSIVDGKTGAQLTRIRGLDEQISMLRVTSQQAYYGSRQGVFLLDGRSASGKRADATYARVAIPGQLERASYGRDAYDPVHQGYTAADRTRVLWTGLPTTQGPMQLAGNTYAIHYFRFLLGFAGNGELRWAYSHPRVELVASDHTGAAIVGVSSNGDVVAVDPASGAVIGRQKLGTTATVLGATFDADGWAPAGPGEPVVAADALSSIARDPDARFDRVKELAVAALARLPGPEVTRQLLGVLAEPRAPQRLKDLVVELLVARRDPGSLPVLAAQLATTSDFLAKTAPEGLGATAKAIAGLGGLPLDPAQVAAAVAALQRHLDAPHTAAPDLAQVIGALAALGGAPARAALGSHLLLYHADGELGGDPVWQKAIASALAARGEPGPADRELLRYVAADPRSQPGLVTAIRDALAGD
ncbi:MAG: outer membrane protein assembly factor BamB family protein [Kofleriaceae bacterium]